MSSYRRPKHHTYDYNYKVGESSYRDMLDYLDRKEGRRAVSPPPGKKTFAERFAERPIYGELRPLHLSQSEPAERSAYSPRPAAADERRARFADAPVDDDFLAVRPRPVLDDAAIDLDPDELIASIRRNRQRLPSEDIQFYKSLNAL
ncbi:uncharacterized protein LOC119097513 [Pollicipes pollicipes]|uniref:uncharacterized protein LOC119097513 n=1 Tax=Pollicipes pollicipes TaxID=41117 RepID=UPI001885440F|nr:uncharacterized protein LOC119097513 [Pollicipes pollicipes]